jgi:Peptidase A4 family
VVRRVWLVVVALIMGASVAVGAGQPASARPVHGLSHGGDVRHGTSGNWAGWANTGGTYTTVFAAWTQPTAHCGLLSGSTYSSFWVGLDGTGSPTVEQTGTEADCGGLGGATYFGWYEFFPAPPHRFPDAVRPGDAMQARVTYIGSHKYTVTLRNVTLGWKHTLTSVVTDGRNKSAEVIAEAPSQGAGGSVLPLTNFGTVSFTGALVNGVALGKVRTPEPITMVGNGVVKAAPSALTSGGTAFTVTWHHR